MATYSKHDENVTAVIEAFVDCALWVGTDENGDSLDDTYYVSDISDEAMATIREDVTNFCLSNGDDLDGMDCGMIGHDFYLTRNGHGAGFWDRGLGVKGDRLTEACRPYGDLDLMPGVDGALYVV